MTGLVTIKGKHDSERLTGWLGDLDGVKVRSYGADHTEVEGLGVTFELDTADAGECEATWWAASRCRRAGRRVADADECASTDLQLVLRDGIWSGPAADDQDGLVGVLLFKPGPPVAGEALVEVGVRLAECGYQVPSARLVSNEEIRRTKMGAAHHGAHSDLANHGRMSSRERASFLRAFETDEFHQRFGMRAHELPVYNAREAVELVGLPRELLNELSAQATMRYGPDSRDPEGPSKIGECLYAQVIQHPGFADGAPFVVLNPHMPRVLDEFHGGSALALSLRAASRTPLSWLRLRREFCGATDPVKALPGSVRGDALAGLLPLRGSGGTPVQRISNGIHLSNGAFESLRDLWNWFGIDPERTKYGQEFFSRDVPIRHLLSHSFVQLDGERRSVMELTDACDVASAASILADVRSISIDEI